MTAVLQVREVRDKIAHLAAKTGGNGRVTAKQDTQSEASTPLLGRLFHEVLADLTGHDKTRNLRAALQDADANLDSQRTELRDHLYNKLVGPRLTVNQACLQDSGAAVLAFWKAVQSAGEWFLELLDLVRANVSGRNAARGLSREARVDLFLEHCFLPEEKLCCELQEPGWTQPVRLVGITDLILRAPQQGAWCVVEFKLGKGAPAADLTQACLYHLMLQRIFGSPSAMQDRFSQNGRPAGAAENALALVSFTPERQEKIYSAADLARFRPQLLAMIGEIAGVLPRQTVSPQTVSPQTVSPQTVSPQAVSPQAATAPTATAPTATAPTAAAAPAMPMINRADSVPNPPTKAHPIPGPPAKPAATAEQRDHGKLLVKTFKEYGAPIELDGDPIVGPTFLRYPVRLSHGVTLASVQRRAQEVQMRLKLSEKPVISFVDGQVVIDVQRPDRQTVFFSQIRDLLPTPDPLLGCSQLPIGIALDGSLKMADLASTEHCHMLVAGTTGSGKSEWIRSAIAGLLVTNTPDTLRLLLIDPKRNAFHDLRNSPFLWRPLVFPGETSVIEVLEDLVNEMERRYALLEGADSLKRYIERTGESVPRIVCVCDEYYDLISRSRKERDVIEGLISRLGAKARAAGIHLILATQQPNRQVVSSALDANMPARVGLRVSKAIESRTLLGGNGAESLLGQGDLLFKDIGEPERLQSPYLSEEERREIFTAGIEQPRFAAQT